MTGTAEIRLENGRTAQKTLQDVILTYVSESRIGILWGQLPSMAEPGEIITVHRATCDILHNDPDEVHIDGFSEDEETGKFARCRIRFLPERR